MEVAEQTTMAALTEHLAKRERLLGGDRGCDLDTGVVNPLSTQAVSPTDARRYAHWVRQLNCIIRACATLFPKNMIRSRHNLSPHTKVPKGTPTAVVKLMLHIKTEAGRYSLIRVPERSTITDISVDDVAQSVADAIEGNISS